VLLVASAHAARGVPSSAQLTSGTARRSSASWNSPRPSEEESCHVSRLRNSLLPLIAIAALAAPPGATASPHEVLRDCRDGALDGSHSTKDLKGALDNMPADLDEYSDCREIIGAAIKGGSDRGGGRPDADPSAGGAATSRDEQAARAKDTEDFAALTGKYAGGDSPRIDVGGETVTPGENGLFKVASASNDVPTPLVLALVALLLLAVAGGVIALRSRLPVLARVPGLSKLSLPNVRVPGLFRR
jgi:hypothetical protein